jgi:hypothetical protein
MSRSAAGRLYFFSPVAGTVHAHLGSPLSRNIVPLLPDLNCFQAKLPPGNFQ